MKALVLEDFWKLQVADLADPVPGEGEVLIDVIATGICGSDFHGYSGENGRRRAGQVMGHETVGRVRAVGPAVADAPAAGTLVTVNPVLACGHCPACLAGDEPDCPNKRVIGVDPAIVSAFAQQLVVPRRAVVPLPAGTPEEYGALVEPLAVGYHALVRGECTDADTVLVIGGGPIGQACVLAAKRLGAKAIAVSEPDQHRRELSAALGAIGVDPTAQDATAAIGQALGGAPSLVVDAVGVDATLATAFACTDPSARIVLVGMGSQQLTIPAFEISTRQRSLIGSFCYTAREFADTAAWVGTRPAGVDTLVEGRVGIDQADAAFSALAKGTSAASKILVFPWQQRIEEVSS
ncbi:zinc-dependent alcohol dehydrogenase [Nakamurella aerolata]|uniref:Alcohol dehydrogenase catalytic domain-containing protein n=1 Tax=Nakamurella aerolata TaxID=1656892 RepID=A0A849A547_9ACTN|nr:alcohol dehydrogenase catalytic domain-containing protein [Nakamurella aerolata]NNG35655.1 alcohol dehydrogenase catalytic domain-containing protein [Nakamurella aerolata]